MRAALLFALIACTVFVGARHVRAQSDAVQHWRRFVNKAGWVVRYPPGWDVGSCGQCTHPTDPNGFVTFYNPSSKELVMIENLMDKPSDQSARRWLDEVSRSTVLNPRVSANWIRLARTQALEVVSRNGDATESENFYLLHGSKTFAIRTPRNSPARRLIQQMLSTFEFVDR